MTDDLLLQTLDRIETNIASVDIKLNDWLTKECPKKHVQIESRMSKLETRIYLACAGLMFIVSLFGPKIANLIWR